MNNKCWVHDFASFNPGIIFANHLQISEYWIIIHATSSDLSSRGLYQSFFCQKREERKANNFFAVPVKSTHLFCIFTNPMAFHRWKSSPKLSSSWNQAEFPTFSAGNFRYISHSAQLSRKLAYPQRGHFYTKMTIEDVFNSGLAMLLKPLLSFRYWSLAAAFSCSPERE